MRSKLLRLTIALTLFASALKGFSSGQQGAAASGPLVDYSSQAAAANQVSAEDQAKRFAKSARYDRPKSLPIKEEPNTIPLPLTSHWWVGLPPLPVNQSDAVILGTASDAHAYLSNDRAAVYSEFSVHVQQVLKDASHTVSPGAVITTTRFGGIVRFPDGHTQQYRISKQGWPVTGGRYVFFCVKTSQATLTLSLLTSCVTAQFSPLIPEMGRSFPSNNIPAVPKQSSLQPLMRPYAVREQKGRDGEIASDLYRRLLPDCG